MKNTLKEVLRLSLSTIVINGAQALSMNIATPFIAVGLDKAWNSNTGHACEIFGESNRLNCWVY